VLVDTGPLVAILSSSDEHHARCVEALRNLPGPLFSCWAVITEAAWLLRSRPRAVQQVLNSIHDGFVEILPLSSLEAKEIAAIMKKYESIRPQLADATLVYLAERDGINIIFTLDRRDFSVYRGARRRAFRLVPEG
jgi:predicted nucleic acid-binding protein